MINKVIIRAKSALRRMKSKKGQTLVEYALILAFISVVAISVLIALGNQVKGVFTTITSQLAISPKQPLVSHVGSEIREVPFSRIPCRSSLRQDQTFVRYISFVLEAI